MTTRHVPVLAHEVIEMLRAAEGGVFADCTMGGGGHTALLLDAAPGNWVVAIDRDAEAVARAEKRFASYGERIEILRGAFSELEQLAGPTRFDGVLADLGMSTDQLWEGRGFSFKDDALDMRMDDRLAVTASDIVNGYSERDLFRVLAKGGVGQEAKTLARMIVKQRPYESAKGLADAVANAHLGKKSSVHPATVVFQAVRMAVNNEIEEIEALLDQASHVVKPGGRLAVITFHSLEDRLVAGTMREWASRGSQPASWRGAPEGEPLGKVVNSKAIVPSDEEVNRNPASRSARLRVFEFRSSASKENR